MNFEIPPGLTDLLQDFTVAVLRQHPADLHRFAADYFGEAYERRRRAEVENGVDNEEDDDCSGRKDVSFGASPLVCPPNENHDSNEESDDEMIG